MQRKGGVGLGGADRWVWRRHTGRKHTVWNGLASAQTIPLHPLRYHRLRERVGERKSREI